MTTTYPLHFDLPAHAAEPSERASGGRSRAVRRGSLVALLAGTALLYLWGLGASGYANDFYAAAVQAGTKSWKAFFFGSLDSANAITVDKPPLSLWPMELSGRIFGFSSWSMLVPQALEGVAAVWLLYATVRRWFGHGAGLLAGALLALTPVAVLMFRFNNPDAAMTLLIVAAAYCTTRAIENASTRWLLGAGAIAGLSFLAKGLQPFTVLPALALAYAVAAPTPLRRRLLQLLGAGVAIVAGAGWWVLAVQLTPAADRPYLGGSGDNSPLGLAFGYNGLSRLNGSGQGGGAGNGFDGSTGIGRMFNALNGGQIAWLLPAALLAIVALAAISRRAARTDRTRAAVLLWGGWLLVTGGVLSFAGGVIHTYYTVELAPAVAALVGIGAVVMWRHRQLAAARLALAAGLLTTGVWTYALLHRTASYPWLGYLGVLAAAVAAGLLILRPEAMTRLLATALVVTGLFAITGGSAAYAVETAGTAHTGSVPSAGPASSAGFGGPGGGAPGRGGFPSGTAGRGQFPGGGQPPAGAQRPSGGQFPGARQLPGGAAAGVGRAAGGGGARVGGPGGGPASVSSALVTLLTKTSTTWAAATIGSQSAAPLELASGKAVMAIGGFSGSDAAPTLAQFEADVRAGKIGYFIADGAGGGAGGPGGGQGTGSAITRWVEQRYTATTVGRSTVYDLSKAPS